MFLRFLYNVSMMCKYVCKSVKDSYTNYQDMNNVYAYKLVSMISI